MKRKLPNAEARGKLQGGYALRCHIVIGAFEVQIDGMLPCNRTIAIMIAFVRELPRQTGSHVTLDAEYHHGLQTYERANDQCARSTTVRVTM